MVSPDEHFLACISEDPIVDLYSLKKCIKIKIKKFNFKHVKKKYISNRINNLFSIE
jgi:hypothetical protein